MMRFATTTALLAALAMVLLPQTALGQFVPPDEGGDSGYAPPPPPPPAPTPTTTTTTSTASSGAPSGDRPLSYSERMKLKQEQERKAKEAEKAKKAAASGGGIAGGPVTQTRPTDFSMGFGIGWHFSQWNLFMADAAANGGGASVTGPAAGTTTSLLNPNAFNARIRFGESVALEPGILLGMGNARSSVDLPGGNDTLDKWDGYGVIIDLAIRYGFMHRASSSALLIFGAGFGVKGIQVDPEGADNITRAMDLLVNLKFGIGAEWFITPHLALSGDVVSPLISVRNVQTNDPTSDVTVSQGTLNLALNFQPGARLMFHVYY